jgi:hypothetical protein
MFKSLLLSFIIVLSGLNSYAASDWELKKDEDGIKVYVRSVEGSSFKEFKGVTTIKNKSITEILDVIFEVKEYDNLFPDVSKQEVVKDFDKYHNIHYVVVHTPWPVSDRDNVTEIEAKIDNDGKSAHVMINTRPELVENKKGLVRIPYGKGFWDLKTNPDNSVTVVYQYLGDPGGSIPSWLANSFVVSHPFETLENLHKRLED